MIRSIVIVISILSLATADELEELINSLHLNATSTTTEGSTSTLDPGIQAGVCPNPNQQCVPAYQCTNASTTGELVIDPRWRSDNPCVSYWLMCCYEQDMIVEPPSEPVTIQPTAVTLTPPGPTSRPTPPPTPTPTPPVTPQESFDECGKRQPNGIGYRIMIPAHNESEYGEFPWMMSIMQKKTFQGAELNEYVCGGSLIHARVVLTAAHCVTNLSPGQLMVRGGEWDTQTSWEPFAVQDRAVTEIVTHPAYYRAGYRNDIALLILNEPMELSEVVQTVCLPSHGTNFDRQRCFVSGWGKDQYGKAGVYQVILKKLELPVVPSVECEAALRTTRLSSKFQLHESFICAGGELGKDACQGDGGSPLVCAIYGSEYYQQAGIVSWGLGCGNTIPGFYVGVSHFREWIDQQMQNRQFDTSSYVP